jgi:hypothetical protein
MSVYILVTALPLTHKIVMHAIYAIYTTSYVSLVTLCSNEPIIQNNFAGSLP